MIRSMTGYGEASSHVDGTHYFLEARSLNNKYLKAVIRLPEEFQALEAELESKLRERINRGTVTITASCTDEAGAAAREINVQAVQKYLDQIRRLPDAQLLTGPLLSSLLSLPGVLLPAAHEEERIHRARAAFAPLLDRALDGLIVMRDREGQGVSADLEAQRQLIAERLVQITGRAPEVVSEYQRRLKARIEQLLREADVQLEVGDLIREIAIYAERIDIAEEISRLGGHLQQFQEMLSLPGAKPIGRTLDFLAQEMLREANTIASKSPDASISRWTVDVKGAIDRIKEQAANVE
ncbi:MAG: YicC/YloC family endoribonuclease [Planctomycetota bacterium]